MTKVDPKLFDTRLIRRNLSSGLISEKDVEAHMKSLPDDEANLDYVTIDLEDSEISEVARAEEASAGRSAETASEGEEPTEPGDTPPGSTEGV